MQWRDQMKKTKKLTAERLKEVLTYYPLTGKFKRNISAGGRCAGTFAGKVCNNGDFEIKIDYVSHKGSRLAWMYMTEKAADKRLTYKDGNPLNLKWENIMIRRTKTDMENIDIDRHGKYRLRICGKFFGNFKTLEDAMYEKIKRTEIVR